MFLEILTVNCCIDLHRFADARRGDGDDELFHANLERVVGWARGNICVSSHHVRYTRCTDFTNRVVEKIVELVIGMIAEEPWKRPTAVEIRDHLEEIFGQGHLYTAGLCFSLTPEPYEAYTTSNTREN
jgi:hypothetical protein